MARPASAPELAARVELARRLRRRAPETEVALRAHLQAVGEPGIEPERLRESLRAAVPESLAYAIACIEASPDAPPPALPAGALAEARAAAAAQVGLGAVLRLCSAGELLLARVVGAAGAGLGRELEEAAGRAQRQAAERLVDALSGAYAGELERLRRSPTQRRADLVAELLAGRRREDAGELGYHLEQCHVGLVASGSGARAAATGLAASCSPSSLVVPAPEGAWIWLGGCEEPPQERLEAALGAAPAGLAIGVGEPRRGLAGWRLSHREARLAIAATELTGERLARCKDRLLVVAAAADPAVAESLLQTYLAPLGGRDAEELRATLRAYLEAGCNAVAAAAALRVNRHTVQRRLRRIEEALGGPVHTWHAELKVALDLEQARG